MRGKLVRDGYLHAPSDDHTTFDILNPKSVISALVDKLFEESKEVEGAIVKEKEGGSRLKILEECGDVYDVLVEIVKRHGYTIDDLQNSSREKTKEKGGFSQGVYMMYGIKKED